VLGHTRMLPHRPSGGSDASISLRELDALRKEPPTGRCAAPREVAHGGGRGPPGSVAVRNRGSSLDSVYLPILAIRPTIVPGIPSVLTTILPEVLPRLPTLLTELAEVVDLTGPHGVRSTRQTEFILVQLAVVVLVETSHPVGMASLGLLPQCAPSQAALLFRERAVLVLIEALDHGLLVPLRPRANPRLRQPTLTGVETPIAIRIEFAKQELARGLGRLQPIVLVPGVLPILAPVQARVLPVFPTFLPGFLSISSSILAVVLPIGLLVAAMILAIVPPLLPTLDTRHALGERGRDNGRQERGAQHIPGPHHGVLPTAGRRARGLSILCRRLSGPAAAAEALLRPHIDLRTPAHPT